MKAPFVASLIRTGHLDSPVWRAIRYALHKWVRDISPLNRALDLLQGEGYTRMMAIAIATEFDKQCRTRNQFASKNDDSPIYELPDTQRQIFSHPESVSTLQSSQSGNGVSAANGEGQAGLHIVPLQKSGMQPLRADDESDALSESE
jgi:hypothetical protein